MDIPRQRWKERTCNVIGLLQQKKERKKELTVISWTREKIRTQRRY